MGSLPRPTIEYNPQQNDPLSAIEKVTSLRSMLQNQQLKQQEVQAAQLENQQRQMAVRDQQVVRDAFVKNGGDPDKTLQDAARAGVSPATLQQLQLHAADLKTKNLALINAQGEKALRDADLMKGAYDTLVKTPPEQRPQVYPQLVNGLKQAQVDVSQLSPQYPGDDHLPILGALIQGHSKGIEEAAKQAGISKDQATAAKDQAETTKTQLETSVMQQFGGMSPQLADSKYRFLQSRLSAKQPISADDQAFIKGYEKQKLLVPQTTAQIRVEGMGQNREYPVLDTKNGNTVVYANANDINSGNKLTPGRFVPAVEGAKSLNKEALIEDIRGNIQQTRDSLNNPKLPEFTATQRAQIAVALGGKEPASALSAAIRGGVLGNLTPEQQDYLINHAQLVENAMAMRSVLGAGQGSDDLRNAIRGTIPGPNTPSKAYALKQLDKFESVLNRLKKGVPNVPLSASPASQSAPNTGAAVTATGPNGHQIVVRGGKWVDAQSGQPIQ